MEVGLRPASRGCRTRARPRVRHGPDTRTAHGAPTCTGRERGGLARGGALAFWALRPSPVGSGLDHRGADPMSDLWGSRPFDLSDPLPTGVTVLEASAGTGKTYTIAALAARFVAEGRDLKQLLLVTFTRMATGELRERVRERLVSAEQA